MNFTPDERQLIIEAATRTGYQGPHSPFKLVREWERFVRSLTNGYEFSIYDYDNDLSMRTTLAQIGSTLPQPLEAKLNEALSESDALFFKQTREVRRHPAIDSEAHLYPWLVRVPNTNCSQLMADLNLP